MGRSRTKSNNTVKGGRAATGTPLSYAQQRLWFLDRFGGSTPEYNIVSLLRISGRINHNALCQAFQDVVLRHDALRTRIVPEAEEPIQVVDAAVSDLRIWPTDGFDRTDDAVNRIVEVEWNTPFDLTSGPLIRAALLTLGPEDHVLVRTVHHIVCDGWSNSILDSDLVRCYAKRSVGQSPELPQPVTTYADYVHAERAKVANGAYIGALDYWRTRLTGVAPDLGLDTDCPRSAATSHNGACYRSVIAGTLLDSLKELCRTEHATPYMVLLAVFGLLLERYTGQNDMVVGFPASNRDDIRFEQVVGMFVNTLPVRLHIDLKANFRALVRGVRESVIRALDHQVPFELLARNITVDRATNRHPLCQVMFALQHASAPCRVADVTWTPALAAGPKVRFDFELHAVVHSDHVQMNWIYDCELFDGRRVTHCAEQYHDLLEEVIRSPDVPVRTIRLSTNTVVDSGEPLPPARHANLAHMVDEQARRTAGACALIRGTLRFTYAELTAQADRFAEFLIRLGVRPGGIVAVVLPRDEYLVISLLAVLKAGAAYLPIDPAYPRKRRDLALADAKPTVVLTSADLHDHIVLDGSLVVDVRRAIATFNSEAGLQVQVLPHERHAAYVLFTSGSTGRPKAVVIEHRSALAFVRWATTTFAYDDIAMTACSTSASFDLFIFELFVPLCMGGTVVLLDTIADVDQVADDLTLINTVPAAMTELVSGRLPRSLRLINLAGEPLSPSLVAQCFERTSVRAVFNLYGPTEHTTYATYARLHPGSPVNIGRPVSGTAAYVLDSELRRCPKGVSGELYLAGDGLARGYLNQPGRTAERFVANPFGGPGDRMYRTGDRARWNFDNQLEFLGRVDRQVKLRGFRIEPGEIEAVLSAHPAVEQCLVRVVGGELNARLVAYYTPAPDASDVPHLAEWVRTHLPPFMVPASFIRMDRFPTNPNGKVDQGALPVPVPDAPTVQWTPTDQHEILVSQCFCEVLGIATVGADDDFFALGGHSLAAMRVATRLSRAVEREVSVRDVFASPTVAGLARHLRRGPPHSNLMKPRRRPSLVPLSFPQQRLWFLDWMRGGSPEYNMPEALRMRGRVDVTALRQAFDALVSRHESLRTRFVEERGQPWQVIQPAASTPLPLEDLSGRSSEERSRLLGSALRAEEHRPFALTNGDTRRWRLFKLGPNDYALSYTLHHIVFDGWSQAIFGRELRRLYNHYSAGVEHGLPQLELQYPDFALWQRTELSADRLAPGLEYWRQELAGVPTVLPLATDRRRPGEHLNAANGIHLAVSSDLSEAVRRIAVATGTTLYMALMAVYAALLSKYTGANDLVIGSPFANRTDPRLEGVIGFFVNILPMRIRLKRGMTWLELLESVRRVTLNAYDHQYVPFEFVVDEVNPVRAVNTMPLCQVVFAVQNTPTQCESFHDINVQPLRREASTIRFDLETYVLDTAGSIAMYWLYNVSLFDDWRIQRLAANYLHILKDAVAHPERSVDECAIA